MAKRKSIKKTSIRFFLISWMSGVGISLLALSAFLVISTNLLQSMAARIYADSQATKDIEDLEGDIVDAQREDIFARMPDNHDIYTKRRDEKITLSGNLITKLTYTVSSDREQGLYTTMQEKFFNMKAELGRPQESEEAVGAITDDLLKSIADFSAENNNQMKETLARSATINKFVNRTTAALVAMILLVIVGVSAAIINKIVQPTFSLINAAGRFGKGDFSARTKVRRDDELGALASTFNDMADGISNAQQDRANLIAAVAHDLKNPLAVVGAAAYRLRKKGPVTEEQNQWLGRIIQQTERIDVMISDLLDSVRIEAGRLELRKTLIDLNELLSEQACAQGECFGTHKIVFESQGRCMIDGDRRLLERVFANVITNAAKYSPEKSTVTIKIEKRAGSAMVTVRDEGEGIPPDELEDIFLPFKRLARTQGMAQGFGLGLFSVKQIVERHGGDIRIESEIQAGTTVEISLPLTRQEIDSPNDEESP